MGWKMRLSSRPISPVVDTERVINGAENDTKIVKKQAVYQLWEADMALFLGSSSG
jgi:hypothetical protein